MPAPAVGSALYRVTFEATWSAATHANFLAGAHFSLLIGLSHRADGFVFRPGQLASLGVKNVTDISNNAALRAEITRLRTDGAALSLLDGRGAAGHKREEKAAGAWRGNGLASGEDEQARPSLHALCKIASRPTYQAAGAGA